MDCFCCMRASNRSGQRLLPSVVLARPSVMLSPMRMKVEEDDGTRASMEVRKYQCAPFVRVGPVREGEETWLPFVHPVLWSAL